MNKRIFSILAVVVLASSVVGCPPQEPEEPEEKEPTPEEIQAEGESILSEIDGLVSVGPTEIEGVVNQLRSRLSSFRSQYSGYETGRTMINRISSKLYGNASGLFEMKNYKGCLMATGLVLAINPTHARAKNLQGRAREELAKPRVQLEGFFQPPDQPTIAFLQIEYLQTGQKDTKQVQLGEEFDGYRFKKITEDVTGKPTGIVLRWLKTGSDVELALHGR